MYKKEQVTQIEFGHFILYIWSQRREKIHKGYD